MERIYFKIGDNVPKLENGSLLLGYFDGVHKGHQELIRIAKENSSFSSVLLFDTNIGTLLPESKKDVRELTSLEDKLNIFESFGIDRAYIVHTDLAFLALRKEKFIQKVLKPINPSLIVVGEDYTFGYKKEGTISFLKEYFPIISSPLLKDSFGKVSTRTIISLIEKGDVKDANEELTYLYSLKGKVIHGLENGRKIHYPTANILLSNNYVIPKRGVYAGYVFLDSTKYQAIINIGNNPTVGKLKNDILEAHILNFNQDIYNKDIKVSFLDFIRDEKKFSSLEDLKIQLDYDRTYFERNNIE